jgi:hypothetical protein
LTLLADPGFDAASLVQIAAAIGIPAHEVVGTVGTKDEIVLGVAGDMLGSVVENAFLGKRIPVLVKLAVEGADRRAAYDSSTP